MTETQTIHLIDDDAAVRDSVALLLTTEGFNVCSYASAPEFFKTVDVARDGCVITDVRMPEMNGIELITKMKNEHIQLPVIVLTAYADVPLAVEAMKLGAIDLLEKPFDDGTLLTAVRTALARQSVEQSRSRETRAIKEKLDGLSRREKEILAGLLKGQSNKIIAHDLGISVRTAEVHRANIMSKMRATNLADLVKMTLAVTNETDVTRDA